MAKFTSSRTFQIVIGISILMVAAGLAVLPGMIIGSSDRPVTPRNFVRISSPDSLFDAVFSEHDCGATCDFTYHLSIVPLGARPAKVPTGDLFTAADLSGVTIRWLGSRLLEIGYSDGQVFRSEAIWELPTKAGYDRVRLTFVQRPVDLTMPDTLKLWPTVSR